MSEDKTSILIVAGDNGNLHEIETILRSLGHQVVLAHDGEEALKRVGESSPGVILYDNPLTKIDGFEIVRKLKEDKATRIIPIVMMTALTEVEDRLKALEAGADDFLTKPVEKTELQARVNSLLKVRAYNEHLGYEEDIETEVTKRTEAIKKSFERIKVASLDTVYRLSRAAEYKDEDTRKMGCDEEFLENMLFAAPMHDIGKIGIPDRVLQKPAKLDPDEWEIMRTHTTIGADILKDADADFIKMGEQIALSHHEKWDGGGYPQGLSSEETPLAARIVAMADVFDALTSERPYKQPFPLEKVFAIIREGRQTHFDPDVVDAFFAIEDEVVAELNWWKFLQSDESDSLESLF